MCNIEYLLRIILRDRNDIFDLIDEGRRRYIVFNKNCKILSPAPHFPVYCMRISKNTYVFKF